MPNQKKDDMDINDQQQAKGMAASAGAGAHRPDAQANEIDAPENVGGDEQLNARRRPEGETGERLDAQGLDSQESQGQYQRQQNQRQQHEE